MEKGSNAYWEQVQSNYWADLDEELLVKKIDDCERVVGELKKSPIWKILTKDAEEKRNYIDENWQDVENEKTLNNMRVKKCAVKYILELENHYQEELERAKIELKKRKNIDNQILKDYDTE